MHRRSPRRAITVAIAVAIAGVVVATGALVDHAGADIEGNTFTSKEHNVRMTLPRGWRISDQATYPGVVLRMFRTRPRGTILLAVDPLPTSIDPSCLERPPTVEGEAAVAAASREVQIACQQRLVLANLGFRVDAIKEAARPWFDYASDKRQLRQGVIVIDDEVFTVVLASDTAAARAQYARTFDKALRSLRALTIEEAEAAAAAEGEPTTPSADGGVPTDATP